MLLWSSKNGQVRLVWPTAADQRRPVGGRLVLCQTRWACCVAVHLSAAEYHGCVGL